MTTRAFELTPQERACGAIRFDGVTLTIRPTSRARGQITWLIGLCAVATLFVAIPVLSGVWFVGVFFSTGLIFYGVMLWRMIVARVVLDRDGISVHNMWSFTRIPASELATLTLDQWQRSSLWTYGLDVRWPFGWSPLVVGRLITSRGKVVEPEALRSDDEGLESEALLKLNLIGRWRSTWWLPTPATHAGPESLP